MKWITNLELALLAPAAVILGALNVPYVVSLTGMDLSGSIDSMILFGLAVIAVSVWQDRSFRQRILDRVDLAEVGVIQDSLPANVVAEVRKAEKVLIIGVSALSQITEFLHVLEAKLADGDEICVLLTDPQSAFVEISASRDQQADVDYQRNRIAESVRKVDALRSKGRVRLKQTKAPIDGEYLVLYESGAISRIYYKHYGYKTRSDSSMFLHLDERVPECFAYFKRHVGQLWDEPS